MVWYVALGSSVPGESIGSAESLQRGGFGGSPLLDDASLLDDVAVAVAVENVIAGVPPAPPSPW